MAMWPARYKRKWLAASAALAVVVVWATAAMFYSRQQVERVAETITGGSSSHAPEIMRRYGCGGCHNIPGVPGADGLTGPPLSGLINRVYIGGVTTNSPDHLIQWIVAPQKLSPHSAMPATGISESEARDVAAYLYAR
jgi:cytochrome c2